jgi:phenylpyruvate tautomerase PptA (4-oxalocrotonate tautomerase family)
MPFVQVHTSADTTPAARRSLGFALAGAYGEYMQTSSRIVNVGFVHYAEDELVRYDAANDEPRAMTIVTCEIRTGRSPEMLESLGRAITEVCSRELGVPPARIAVYLSEHHPAEIFRDGGRAPDWSPSEQKTS